jgi:hypothetical protein
MFVIAGISKKFHPVGLYNMFCNVCQNPGVHQGGVEKMAFSVFFVPLIPLGSRKRLICNACATVTKTKDFPHEYEIPLTKMSMQPSGPRIVAQTAQPQNQTSNPITPQQKPGSKSVGPASSQGEKVQPVVTTSSPEDAKKKTTTKSKDVPPPPPPPS